MAAPADPLARYPAAHRLKVRAQARRLARILVEAIPPTERGGWSGDQWEEGFYQALLEQCAPPSPWATPRTLPLRPRAH